MKLTYQSYGSSILLYINANTNEEAYGKYLSLYNWGCTSTGENGGSFDFERVPFVKEGVIAVWTTIERLQDYLINVGLTHLIKDPKYKGVDGGAMADTRALANAEFAKIEQESYRSVNGSFVEHSFGTIEAEKPDLDYKDECWKAALA